MLAAAATLGERAERAADEFDLMEIRMNRAAALMLRGRAGEAAEYLDWGVEAAARTGRADFITANFGCAAAVRVAMGQHEAAAELLAGIDTAPGLRDADAIAAELPTIVRAALTIGEIELAQRIAGHLHRGTPTRSTP